MSSKNKNKGGNKESSGEGGASAPKAPRKERAPLGPLPDRLAAKAEAVHGMVLDLAKQLATRGAPQSARDAAAAFVDQVAQWKEIFIGLKTAGWEPSSASAKAPIVEGDPIKILDEHVGRYAFVFEGQPDVQLVAGAVVTNGKIIEVMLKDTHGKFYGYAPRRFLAHRR